MIPVSNQDQKENPIPSRNIDVKRRKKKHSDKKKKELNNFFNIPKMYQQWSQIFENDETKNILLLHKPWDHKIPLKPGKELTFELIWLLLEEKLKVV